MLPKVQDLKALQAEHLSMLTLDGVHICRFDKPSLTVHNMLRCSNKRSDREEFALWMTNWNNNVLPDQTLSENTPYMVRELTSEEAEAFEDAKSKMLRAKRVAMNRWESKIFGDMV